MKDLKKREGSPWGRAALGWLVAAAGIGLWLRASQVWPFGFGNFRYLTHAHSHLALLGWLYGALFALLWPAFGGDRRLGGALFWTQQVSLGGMLVAFPLQGYATVSILFSTLFVFCTYGCAAGLWRRAIGAGGAAGLALRISLVFLLLSSLGPYALGYLMARDLGHLHWYRNAVYFYLHFFYNGFVLWGLIALALRRGAERGLRPWLSQAELWRWAAGTALALFVSVLWMRPPPVFHVLAFLGAAAQLEVASRALGRAWKRRGEYGLTRSERVWLSWLLAGFAAKFGAEVAASVPAVASWVAGRHSFAVIGYLHFVMLGLFTPALLGSLYPLRGWGRGAIACAAALAGGLALTTGLLAGQALWPPLGSVVPLFPSLFAGYALVVAALFGLWLSLGKRDTSDLGV